MLYLERFSFGVGDRFGHQALPQLRAFEKLAKDGVEVVPVWNKSNREHSFIGTHPSSVWNAAKAAVEEAGWKKPFYVDADHIQIATVDPFVDCSNFFTIDVAHAIGKPAPESEIQAFVQRHSELWQPLQIKDIQAPLNVSREGVEAIARKYLLATQEAGNTYRYIANKKGEGNFVPEVSMDETDEPQTPVELLVILAAFADQKLPLQTVAPKFTGRFNKGVDYVGNLKQFEQEFRDDLAVIAYAIQRYDLPTNLKLSVHSGSDKFRLYPIIRKALADRKAGLHLKTAGTTWLEEIIGLAESGGDGLTLAKEVYVYARQHLDDLCAPYASVIDIDQSKLPDEPLIASMNGSEFANAIRHNPTSPLYNQHMRQLLHVSFKVAAKAGSRYINLLEANREIVAKNVSENIYDRHLRPLFLG